MARKKIRKVIARLWKGERPTSEELLSYLSFPPQLKVVMEHLTYNSNSIPPQSIPCSSLEFWMSLSRLCRRQRKTLPHLIDTIDGDGRGTPPSHGGNSPSFSMELECTNTVLRPG